MTIVVVAVVMLRMRGEVLMASVMVNLRVGMVMTAALLTLRSPLPSPVAPPSRLWKRWKDGRQNRTQSSDVTHNQHSNSQNLHSLAEDAKACVWSGNRVVVRGGSFNICRIQEFVQSMSCEHEEHESISNCSPFFSLTTCVTLHWETR